VVTAGSPLLLLPVEVFQGWGGLATDGPGPSDYDTLAVTQTDTRRCGYSRLATIRRAGLTGLLLDLQGPAHWLADEGGGGTLVKLAGAASHDEVHLRGLVARVRSFTPWTSFSLPSGPAVLLDASCHHAELEEGHHDEASWLRLELGAGRWIVDVASERGVELIRVRRG
jgi:hypothetical protein